MIVELSNVTKKFSEGGEALSGINLSFRKGELTSVLGPSGCGKTTMLRIIAGLETPSAGQVFIKSQRVDHLPPQQRDIGFVFQNYALFKHMTIFENIAFGLRLKKYDKKHIRKKVFNLLHLVGLDGLERRYPDQLSGGQRQRIALARALAPEPSIMLLDEPFSAVDFQMRKELRKLIRLLHDQISVTTIFVTHDQQDAMELADRVIVLNQGKVEQIGTPLEIYENPASHFVAGFMGGVNYYRTRIKDGCAVLGVMQVKAYKQVESSQVEVLIRPGDLRIESCHESKNEAAARVIRSIFMGDFYKVDLKLDENLMITAHVPKDQGRTLQIGELVTVQATNSSLFKIA